MLNLKKVKYIIFDCNGLLILLFISTWIGHIIFKLPELLIPNLFVSLLLFLDMLENINNHYFKYYDLIMIFYGSLLFILNIIIQNEFFGSLILLFVLIMRVILCISWLPYNKT